MRAAVRPDLLRLKLEGDESLDYEVTKNTLARREGSWLKLVVDSTGDHFDRYKYSSSLFFGDGVKVAPSVPLS